MAGCPLLCSYTKYEFLATNIWTKMLWKNVSAYGIKVGLNYPKMKQPRGSQDKCIMEMLVKGFGMNKKEPIRFNRVRKHQQATFLSDITTAKRDKIDKLLMSD